HFMTALTSQHKVVFESIALKLGHDIHELSRGRAQESELHLTSIDQARAIMCHADEATRRQRGKTFYDNISARQNRLEGYHDRANAYVFADGTLSDEDRRFINRNFPLRATVMSLADKTLQPGEVWTLGVNQPAVVVNLGTLTMMPGSKVVVYSSVLSFTCQNLIRQSASPGAHELLAASPHLSAVSGNYDFGVLGLNTDTWVRFTLPASSWASVLNAGTVTSSLATQFASNGYGVTSGTPIKVIGSSSGWRIVDFVLMVSYSLLVDPLNPANINVYQVAMQGTTGANGTQPGQAPSGTCKCSNTEPGSNGQNGYIGGNAANGGQGTQAPEGMPNLRADITIGSLTGTLVVLTKGGDGSQGGKGGTGGTGGKGGKGGYGTQCTGTCDNGGDGGTGGPGGDGGTGGKGGNGANANDIFITVPADQASQIVRVAQASVAGLAGAGGDGGPGGPGGDAGGASMYCSGGGTGNTGTAGKVGSLGAPGDRGGLAGRIFINGAP
ncbi:MAG TPA: hypothetical protein VFT22_10090, partial [Kofleriaceae bacterium]|nr:hypothetical protein [Kofleriaceae bacterium]